MIPGLGGRLLSSSFAADVLPELSGIHEPPAAIARLSGRWNATREAELGPATSVRAVADVAAVPLLELLGYRIVSRRDATNRCDLLLSAGRASIPAIVAPWSHSLDAMWRDAVRAGIASDARWCFCTNGRALRIVDTQRTWNRSHIEFDLHIAAHVPDTLRLLWTVVRADAVGGASPFLDRVVELSARHGIGVCRALADGVLDALRTVVQALAAPGRGLALPALLEQSLTVLYRVLFLLFAEARGLVPVWHPIYRDRYAIDSILSAVMAGRRYRGAWQALQAIARMAHAGCRAGDLRVPAFNGRLFSPLHAPAAERGRVDDETIGRALVAVATAPARQSGRTRIRYRDLDVEQLGAVYEHVLDYEAAREAGRVALRRAGDARKASGTFYTSRSVTSYLVRRTLAPLVRNRSAAEILRLRVVDPAMGSGAFLVAACRYLASAAEAALLRDGEWQPDDATREARVMLRREVAQRCLFGVDVNPMAVQLARLSLWLATLAGDRPLTFLDHRLAVGDSLAGASLGDALARPPGPGSRRRPRASLPLFDADALAAVVRTVVDARLRLALERDDDVQVVRRKETALAALRQRGSVFMRWKTLLDLWCACWFWDGDRPAAAVFHALSDSMVRGRSSLPAHVEREWHERARSTAERRRFFHWEVEFPEVFFDEGGRRSARGGFDAVLSNPPWDMVRGDSGESGVREERRTDARRLVEFVRGAGIYTAAAGAHVNRYQLFAERALQLARPDGRVGLVLPSGVVTDTGSATLRRHLFERADVDSVAGLDNRASIFPIHRSVRFVLLTATTARPTERIACRFGVSDPADLDAVDESGLQAPAFPVTLSRSFVARVSGEDDLAIPELATAMDLRILEKITASHPWLSSAAGWHARFGRELNASDDRGAFVPATGARGARPVLEGRQIGPFRVTPEASRYELSPAAMFTTRVSPRARLAYRDVASATNRLTLIAAIVPALAVTTHTLFCLRTPFSYERQLTLCALLNSFVANYLVRLRVNTHVTIAITSRLPVPVVAEDDPAARRLAELARILSGATAPVETMAEYVELQALATHLYGLSTEELARILDTFPLIPRPVRDETLASFSALSRS
ncbi:MAG: Eco57I restriction-modification methylase domain-containing protein [Vicinamibacterales bacterium]